MYYSDNAIKTINHRVFVHVYERVINTDKTYEVTKYILYLCLFKHIM